MKSRIVTAIAVVAVLSGCGEPKVDASSEAAAKASIAEITESLSGEKRASFERAVKIVAFQGIDVGAILAGTQTAESLKGDMLKKLDGKTADQVIATADAIVAERAAREKQQAVEEIKELEARAQAADRAQDALKSFSVTRSRFYISDGQYSFQRKPVIELSVENGTGQPVSRAYFKGTIASPGRAIPWLQENFNYQIPGGLESGEKADWALNPNMFSDWGKVQAPSDAIFTVEVVRLDGADGNPLYDATGLSEREQQRLSELREKYQLN